MNLLPILNSLYKTAALMTEQQRETDLLPLLNSFYKTATLLGEQQKIDDLLPLSNSFYKIAAILREQQKIDDLLPLLNSLYRIAAILKGKKIEVNPSVISSSAYRITFSLKKSNRESQDILLPYLEGARRIIQTEYFKKNQTKILKDLEDATSFGQLESKTWLLKMLKEKNQTSLGTVFVCAGWYGLLPLFLLKNKDFSLRKIFLFDKDPLSIKISEDLNRSHVKANWKFKATKKDILSLNYEKASFKTLKANGKPEDIKVSPDTIINTSCEHLKDFPRWWKKIPEKKLVILQSNDYLDLPFHVNCHSSLKEFKKQAPMKTLLYAGALNLKTYKRFLLIGFK